MSGKRRDSRDQPSAEAPPLKRCKKTMPPATMIPPESIIKYNILTRLPIKSLSRFMSVSKDWYTVISGDDPLFADLQLACFTTRPRAPTSSSMAFLNEQGLVQLSTTPATDTPPAHPLPINTPSKVCVNAIVTASTNGLLCLLCSDDMGRRRFFYIFNPSSTKQHHHRVPAPSNYHAGYNIGLATASTDDDDTYLLVHPTKLARRSSCDAAIYQLNVFSSQHPGQGWTKSEQAVAGVGRDCPCLAESAVFSHGRLFWFSLKCLFWVRCCCGDNNNKPRLEAGHTPMPSRIPHSRSRKVGVCGDLVTLVGLSVNSLAVWVLQEDTDDDNDNHNNNNNKHCYWELKYRVTLRCMVEPNKSIFSRFFSAATDPFKPNNNNNKNKVSRDSIVDQMQPLPFHGGSKVWFVLTPRRPSYEPSDDKEKESDVALLSFDMKSKKMAQVYTGSAHSFTPLPWAFIPCGNSNNCN